MIRWMVAALVVVGVVISGSVGAEVDYSGLGLERYEQPKAPIGFTLNDLSGRAVSLSDYRGKVVFLNFWATWCPPCRAEMPSMENLYRSLKGEPFEILAVNLRESKKKIDSFSRGKYTFPILLDSDGKLSNKYNVRAIPTSYIIDKKGYIRYKAVGARSWDGPESIALFKELIEE